MLAGQVQLRAQPAGGEIINDSRRQRPGSGLTSRHLGRLNKQRSPQGEESVVGLRLLTGAPLPTHPQHAATTSPREHH